MGSPEEILKNTLRRVGEHLLQRYSVPFFEEQSYVEAAELISRNPQNRACVRLVLACALAKSHEPRFDIRKPYTQIGDPDCFSGRTYDETYLGTFLRQHRLPTNDTTAFLTPALRNRNTTLTLEINLVGNPPVVYQAALELLNAVYEKKITAEDLLAEIFRCLVLLRDENEQRLKLLLRSVQDTTQGMIPLSSEEIVILLEQHLQSPNASRLPVIVVAAAYEAVDDFSGEKTNGLEGHNAADRQTGSVGDVEVTLVAEEDVITGYEMKTRRVTIADIDIALQKIVHHEKIQNYIFITTEFIDKEVNEYAKSLYEKTGGREIVILDCIAFLRHFLHFFHRHRAKFVDNYQKLLLAEPDSAVGQPLKETWLALRQAAALRPEG